MCKKRNQRKRHGQARVRVHCDGKEFLQVRVGHGQAQEGERYFYLKFNHNNNYFAQYFTKKNQI
jgi:hypothetical protein